MKTVRYFGEAILLHTLFFLFGVMTPRAASAVGGWIGRSVGPRLAATRKARRHLLVAFPDLSVAEQDRILRGMWDNLGRVIAEYPHLETIATYHTQIIGREALDDLMRDHKSAIFVGAHLANWEINCATALLQMGLSVDITYRPPNNPWSDRLLQKARTLKGRIRAHSKSREGGVSLLRSLKSGHSAGILIDQKYNEGIAVPFFGVEAMTNPAFISLSQKLKCPVIPIRCVRKGEGSFEIYAEDALQVFDENGEVRPVEVILSEANQILEGWIKEYPEQWLWLHKRWGSRVS